MAINATTAELLTTLPGEVAKERVIGERLAAEFLSLILPVLPCAAG